MNRYLDRGFVIGEFKPMPDDHLIICRCEEITKGEIRRAVFDGMWTVTEVKRYLRAGMGLCQGQTCNRLVRDLIAGERKEQPHQPDDNTPRSPARPAEMKQYKNEVID